MRKEIQLWPYYATAEIDEVHFGWNFEFVTGMYYIIAMMPMFLYWLAKPLIKVFFPV